MWAVPAAHRVALSRRIAASCDEQSGAFQGFGDRRKLCGTSSGFRCGKAEGKRHLPEIPKTVAQGGNAPLPRPGTCRDLDIRFTGRKLTAPVRPPCRREAFLFGSWRVELLTPTRPTSPCQWRHLARQGGFCVREMARLASVSRRTLERHFHLQRGTSLQSWLLGLRHRAARRFLRRLEPVEVADLLGYASVRSLKWALRLPARGVPRNPGLLAPPAFGQPPGAAGVAVYSVAAAAGRLAGTGPAVRVPREANGGHAGVSVPTLRQRFRQATGQPLVRWLREACLRFAQRLLQQGRPWKEVAEQAGYSCVRSLRRAWSRQDSRGGKQLSLHRAPSSTSLGPEQRSA